VQDDRLVLDYNRVGEHFIVESAPGTVPLGESHIVLHVNQSPDSEWAPVTMLVDGAVVGAGDVKVLPGGLGNMSTQVGHNAPSRVSMRYEAPFAFSGTIHRIDVDFESPPAHD
jgi:arylsulfatase